MKNTRSLEIGTGLFVLLGFAALAFLTTQLPGTSLKLGAGPEGYAVTAKFDNIGDLKSGSPVTMRRTMSRPAFSVRVVARPTPSGVGSEW